MIFIKFFTPDGLDAEFRRCKAHGLEFDRLDDESYEAFCERVQAEIMKAVPGRQTYLGFMSGLE